MRLHGSLWKAPVLLQYIFLPVSVAIRPLTDAVSIINDLGPLAYTTRHPHCCIHVVVTCIPGVHTHVQSELVQSRVNIVRRSWVVQQRQHLGRTRPPSIRLNLDISRGCIRCFEQIACVESGR